LNAGILNPVQSIGAQRDRLISVPRSIQRWGQSRPQCNQ
jgi:hypothetical protein